MTLTFEPQYRYDFTCSIAQHYTSTDRQTVEGRIIVTE